jgi:hypothetical protein
MCDRPAAYWRLGEPAPPEAFNEVDGGSGCGYVSDGGITYGIPGAIKGDPDTAIHLDGESWASCNDGLSFPNNAPFSLEAWAFSDVSQDGAYRRIVERLGYDGNGSPFDGYILYNQSYVAGERWVDGGDVMASGPEIGNGAYSHVVATYDGAALTLYLNGSAQGTSVAKAPANDISATFFIGGNPRPYAGWIGALDEIAVYPYALTPAQVAAHYRAGRGL